jgi:predicted acetyltransferase
MRTMNLVWPSRETLPSYVAALKRDWTPDSFRGVSVAREQLARIAENADEFLASLVDRRGGAKLVLPDGSVVLRLPAYQRWLWDGEFCGSIGFRWQPGTEALPPHCLGHIGCAVVPWKEGRGYATEALRRMLIEIRSEGLGLRYVEITTHPDNLASQRVIGKNGGVFVEEFTMPASLGGHREFRYRVALGPA